MATAKAGSYIKSSRARKTPGKTVKVGGTQVIKPTKKGQKPLSFQKGGLHKSLNVPQDKKIPASKMVAAKAGKYGPKAKKQANLATGALAKGRSTAQKNKRAKKGK